MAKSSTRELLDALKAVKQSGFNAYRTSEERHGDIPISRAAFDMVMDVLNRHED